MTLVFKSNRTSTLRLPNCPLIAPLCQTKLRAGGESEAAE